MVERKQIDVLEDIADGIPVSSPDGGLPVLGPLTDDELRANAVPVSGSTAAGSAPTNPPLSVSGVDGAGLKRHLATDPAGELHVHAGGYGLSNSTAFIRPADTTAYAVGDLVANNTTAGSVAPMQVTVARKNGGSGRIIRARLMKSGTVLTNASFRVHLYKAAPTPSNGDNGVWLTNAAADYLGAFDLTIDRAFTDGSLGTGVPLTGPVLTFVTGAAVMVVYALVEARAAYTPASGEVFTLTLETDSD